MLAELDESFPADTAVPADAPQNKAARGGGPGRPAPCPPSQWRPLVTVLFTGRPLTSVSVKDGSQTMASRALRDLDSSN